MVAYTTPDCLPYFEGTDSPCLNTGTLCEPSTVWCDLAALIDARFTEWDAVLGRTAVTVPFAQVQRDTPVTVLLSVNDELAVSWEFAVQDNDDMVDLSADSQLIFIRRPGIWVYHFTAVLSAAVALSSIGCQIDTSLATVAASTRNTWVQAVPAPPDDFQGMSLMFDETFVVTEADLAGVSAVSLRARLTGNAPTDVTLYSAVASVYWQAEVPS